MSTAVSCWSRGSVFVPARNDERIGFCTEKKQQATTTAGGGHERHYFLGAARAVLYKQATAGRPPRLLGRRLCVRSAKKKKSEIEPTGRRSRRALTELCFLRPLLAHQVVIVVGWRRIVVPSLLKKAVVVVRRNGGRRLLNARLNARNGKA